MDIRQPLERIGKEYSDVPLDFNSENDVQARLYEATREWLVDQNELETNTTSDFDIRLSGDPPLYTGQYHDQLEASVRQQPLTRVRTELPIWHPLSSMISSDERPIDNGEEILDLAVLSSPIDRPVHMENGKHRIEIEMVDTAVEIKHPRNETAMPSNTRGSLDDLSRDELRETVDFERLGIKADLEELESIGKDYSTTVYFLLTSQYDILRRGVKTNKRHQLLADVAVEKMQRRCNSTSVLYAHPQGWEWIVEN
jgi:hypothetical protein